MIPMKVHDCVRSAVVPAITSKTKAPLSAGIECENGTLTYSLDAPIVNGQVVEVDIENLDAVANCNVKSVTPSVKHGSIAVRQSFSKLDPDKAKAGFRKLIEYVKVADAPVNDN